MYIFTHMHENVAVDDEVYRTVCYVNVIRVELEQGRAVL